MKVTASALQFLGFHEDNQGDPNDVTFDTPVTWLPLPVTTPRTWNGSSDMTGMGDNVTVTYNGRIFGGTENLEVPAGPMKQDGGPPIFWVSCRKVWLHYELTSGAQTVTVGDDTMWYAPGAGLVREYSHEVDQDRDSTNDDILIWAGQEADWPYNRLVRPSPHDGEGAPRGALFAYRCR